MKTFRFFATLLVIALCAGFTSCSDDDDENPLVGVWSYTFDGSTKLVLDWGDDDPETYTVEISDNSLKLIEEGGHTETFIKQ